jgi:mannose-6-phosphate isomerase-like protein (cupin superfamily)
MTGTRQHNQMGSTMKSVSVLWNVVHNHPIIWGLLVIMIVGIIGSRIVYNVHAQSKVNPTAGYTIENCVNEFSVGRVKKSEAGWQFWFVDKNFADGYTLKMSAVAPHSATHAPHVHAGHEIFYIVEGTAEFILGEKTKTVGPNTSLYCPPNIPHGIRNSGATELRYLVIKQYEN